MRTELLDDHPPFADIAAAQGAFDTWRGDYNELRPHQSHDMATPASLFVPRPESIAELVLPPELSIVTGERSVVIEPKDEPEHFSDDPLTPPAEIQAVEFSRVVPPSGNISISEQQVWVGPKSAG